MKVESVVVCNLWGGGGWGGGNHRFWQSVGGFRRRVVGFQLVKTKQIHKLMLTMFDPEEI